jgi:hypothetical protein
VSSWNLIDIVPVLAGGGTVPNLEAPIVVQFCSNPNTWSFSISQAGSTLDVIGAAYGETTGQFADLARLWDTYRLLAVDVEFIPNNTGSGAQSATVSAIDPAGDGVPFLNSQEPVTQISKLRSVSITPAMSKCRRHIDY